MFMIRLITIIVSIGAVKNENVSSNYSIVIVASCQEAHAEIERIDIPLGHYNYFHIFDHSLSSSFRSISPLSYCKHQQTTYYSSSGFDIFRSSPRFPFIGIANSSPNSSFHYKNAVLSSINQSLSTSIVKIMSPNEHNILVDSDLNKLATITTTTTTTTSTTINSLLSTTTTTAISNVSLFHTSLSTTQQGTNRTFNIALLIGCIAATIILIIIIIYAFVKYRNRDEGSYKIDESKNFVVPSNVDSQDSRGCRGKTSSHHYRPKVTASNEQNGLDAREWYV